MPPRRTKRPVSFPKSWGWGIKYIIASVDLGQAPGLLWVDHGFSIPQLGHARVGRWPVTVVRWQFLDMANSPLHQRKVTCAWAVFRSLKLKRRAAN